MLTCWNFVDNTILLTAPLWWRQRRALAFQRWRGPSSRAQRWIVSLVAFVVLPIIIESSGLFNDLVRCSCVSLTADFIHEKSVIQQAPHTGHCVYGPGHCMLQSTTRGHAGMLGVALSPPPQLCADSKPVLYSTTATTGTKLLSVSFL